VLTFSHTAIQAINKALFVMSSFRSHNIIFIEIYVKWRFNFNWSAYY